MEFPTKEVCAAAVEGLSSIGVEYVDRDVSGLA